MLRDREQQGSVQRFGQHLIQIQERALELARVTGNLAWRVWESVVMRIESTRFCFGIRSDICIDHLLTLRCEKIDCEDKALEVVSFLWPFRCRLALPIHGGQDVNTKGVDAWLKFEMVFEPTTTAWLFRVQHCQISADHWSVLGTIETSFAEPESKAKPEMRRG